MPKVTNDQNTKNKEAIERNEHWASLSPEKQLASLDLRLGVGVGAVKQRAKIQAQIDAQ